jgi:Reverse transcriptase (RNA-dependent DNA polymerase)/Endonuclease-reverse transcriptase
VRSSSVVRSFDILALTETWLHPDIMSPELGMQGYKICRRDRHLDCSRKGGGVLLAISESFVSSTVATKYNDIEQIFVRINNGHSNIIVGCLYVPPGSSSDVLSKHCDEILFMRCTFPRAQFIILGDWNLPEICWSDSASIHQVPLSSRASELVDLCNMTLLEQHNRILNCNGRILDLVLSSINTTNVSLSDEVLVPVDLHHPPLSVGVVFDLSPSVSTPLFKYNFFDVDYIALSDAMASIDWSLVLIAGDVNDMLAKFYDILYSLVMSYVPIKKVRTCSYPAWFNSELITLTRAKKVLHLRYKTSLSLSDLLEFRTLRSKCQYLSKALRKSYLQDVESSLLSNSSQKNFWRHVRSLRKDVSSLPDVITFGCFSASTDSEKAEIFARYFSGVYKPSNPVVNPGLTFNPSRLVDIPRFSVSQNLIYRCLLSLDADKSPGFDGLSPLFIKKCALYISYPLYVIFNLSLETGVFPHLWKEGLILPIYKKGDKANAENYRPICLQSQFAKVFERLVLDNIGPSIYPIISHQQHGFFPGRSTLTNLLSYTNYIMSSFSKGVQVDTIYTDFSKAFDTVSITVLIHKLCALGFDSILVQWFQSYLSERTLRVRVGACVSNPFCPTSGVPQGSHIGPVLFAIFCNDMVVNLRGVPCLLFADDLKIFSCVSSHSDALRLQEAVDMLLKWCLVNELDLNINKCFVLSFSRQEVPLVHNYLMENVPIKRVSSSRDLGVIFDSKMTFIPHMVDIRGKAMRMLGLVLRLSKDFHDLHTIATLYKSFVRPQLEYLTPIWSPSYTTHISALERVQNRFLRCLNYRLSGSYSVVDYDLLRTSLAIPTLERRRTLFDALLLRRIIADSFSCTELIEMINFNVPSRPTRQITLFHESFVTNNYLAHSVIFRLHAVGNSLCEIVDFMCDTEESIRRHFLAPSTSPSS